MPPMKISGVDRCGCLIQSARLESSDLRHCNHHHHHHRHRRRCHRHHYLRRQRRRYRRSLSTSLSTRFQPAITIGCDSELGRIQSVWAEYQFFICSWFHSLSLSIPFFRLPVFLLHPSSLGSYDSAPLARISPKGKICSRGIVIGSPGRFDLLTSRPFSHLRHHRRQLNVSFLTN